MRPLLDRLRWLSRLLALTAGLLLVVGAPGAVALEHLCSMTGEPSCHCDHDEGEGEGCCTTRASDTGPEALAMPSEVAPPQTALVALPALPAPAWLPPPPPLARQLVSAPPRGPPDPGGGLPELFVQHCAWLI